MEQEKEKKIKSKAEIMASSVGQLSLAESCVKYICDDLEDIKRNFVDIAFRLSEAYSCRYYLELGFGDIESFSEAMFGFKKSSTYAMLRICWSFMSGMKLKPEYEKYSYSQLVELSSLGLWSDRIPASWTVKDIRDFKKAVKNFYSSSGDPQVYLDKYHKEQQEKIGEVVQTSGNEFKVPDYGENYESVVAVTSVYPEADEVYECIIKDRLIDGLYGYGVLSLKDDTRFVEAKRLLYASIVKKFDEYDFEFRLNGTTYSKRNLALFVLNAIFGG